MNAAIRAVVRTGIAKGWEIFGVRNGYAGLVDGQIEPLGARDVGGILQRGGTFLGSARLREFKDEPVRARGLANLRGARDRRPGRHRRQRLAVGRAGAVADGAGGRRRRLDDRQRSRRVSEITIGVDTALNIALEAIDRLRVTASSHKRAFLVEVMGRNCGYLALMAGIAGGAESVVIPEAEVEPEVIAHESRRLRARQGRTRWWSSPRGRATTPPGWREHFERAQGAAGLRPARDDAGPRAARRRRRARSTACWRRGWRPRPTECLARGEHGCLVGLHARRGAHDAADRRGRHAARPSTSSCSSCRRCSPSDRVRWLERAADGAARELASFGACCSTSRSPAPTACGTRGRRTTPRSPAR